MKARVFVMSLQEFFRELFDLAAPGISDSDQWALEYLGVSWLQPLMDAFDEDASGYVTIAEVNRLMDTRPSELTWRYVQLVFTWARTDQISSIPHWMAYWAIGRVHPNGRQVCSSKLTKAPYHRMAARRAYLCHEDTQTSQLDP